MRASARWRGGESGGAVVELALLTMVLVPILLYAVFFFEVSLAKLKAHEASRYLVWEMTAAGLSDYREGNHERLFEQARSQVVDEVSERWGDDLDGATPTFTGGARPSQPITVRFSLEASELENASAGAFDIDAGGVGSGAAGGMVDGAMARFNFNSKGKAVGAFRVRARNVWLGKTLPIVFEERMLLSDELVISSRQSLIADQWDLKEGGPVVEIEGEPDRECTSGYCKQVARMAFLGLGGILPVSGQIQQYAGLLDIHWFLSASVASLPLEGFPSDSSHDLRVADPPGHQTIRKGFTNVFNDRSSKPPGYVVSTYNKVYRRRGGFYMGCKQAQQSECRY